VRLGLVIVCMAAIAVALVHLRRQELDVRHEVQGVEAYQVRLRRMLWHQERDLGYLTAPAKVHDRAVRMAIIPDDQDPRTGVADASEQEPRWDR